MLILELRLNNVFSEYKAKL